MRKFFSVGGATLLSGVVVESDKLSDKELAELAKEIAASFLEALENPEVLQNASEYMKSGLPDNTRPSPPFTECLEHALFDAGPLRQKLTSPRTGSEARSLLKGIVRNFVKVT